MLTRIILIVCLLGIGLAVAYFLQLRKPQPPISPSYLIPGNVIPEDFEFGREALYVLALFSSDECRSCAKIWDQINNLKLNQVYVQKISLEADSKLFKRYKIDGVPALLLISNSGQVITSHLGNVDINKLEADIVEQIKKD